MKWIQILNYIGILLLLLACQRNEIDHTPPTSKELPDHLKLDVNVEDVNKVSEAKIYTANFIELDPEHLADQLLQEPIVNEELYHLVYNTKQKVMLSKST
ncbi:hypothetical protein [Amphibacillus cookii]|uniref:hypothetical protein n=1 Tax=Amphibacillus cookii TaxID=767787 RepID=UPI0019565D46|nr:hypothetical protein [Amphibacillus cookii]MBM7542336.1 hypothetical protein [Amphibacillus cookii]